MKEFKFIINGHKYEVSVNEIENQLAEVTVNGTPFQVQIEKEEKAAVAPVRKIQSASVTSQATTPTVTGTQAIKSPLPGSIVKVNVKAGDQVKVGDELLTMESMKMENSIKSEYAGTVKSVSVEAGKNVMQDDLLLEIETTAAVSAPQAEAPKAAPATPKATPAPAPTPKPATPAGGFKVNSPLPGSVVKVAVTEGQQIKKGDLLLTLESMKMENSVLAEQDGVIRQVAVSAGQNVMQDDLLVVIG